MEQITTIEELYAEFLRDIYNAEVLQVSELLYFKKEADSATLKQLIGTHLNNCRAQMYRLEDVMERLGDSLLEDHCRTMRSLIKEAKTLVDRCVERSVKDFALVSSLLRINQCKISVYSTLISMATRLGYTKEIEKLQKSLGDEIDFQIALKDKGLLTLKLKQPEL